MPRRSAADALLTRDAIIDRAVDLASTDGLEGITIGRLAGDLTMSKAGVIGHFGTKEALQLAAVDAAVARFTRAVWQPVARMPPGLTRLRALCAAWHDYLEGDLFPGGCFLSAASFEFDDREGPVRDRIAAALEQWRAALRADAQAAIDAGELPGEDDADQLAFELQAYGLAATQARRLDRDEHAVDRARRATARVLGT